MSELNNVVGLALTPSTYEEVSLLAPVKKLDGVAEALGCASVLVVSSSKQMCTSVGTIAKGDLLLWRDGAQRQAGFANYMIKVEAPGSSPIHMVHVRKLTFLQAAYWSEDGAVDVMVSPLIVTGAYPHHKCGAIVRVVLPFVL